MSIYLDPKFIAFLVQYNHIEDYYECHELLEDLWVEGQIHTKIHPLPMLILIATGHYHYRRGNRVGAIRTLSNAIHRFEEIPDDFKQQVPIHWGEWITALQLQLDVWKKQGPFQTTPIPISSDVQPLVERTRLHTVQPPKESLIHKHKTVFQHKKQRGTH